MTTTDSVMRELVEQLLDWNPPYKEDREEVTKLYKKALSHSLAEARREERIDLYKKALDDMFLEICKLAEPDERQFGAGDLQTNMDDIHNIRTMLLTSFKKEVDLLTGDNPERKV